LSKESEDKDKEKVDKMVKAINPKHPKNPDGTTFMENLKGSYKGKHRDEK
jgi:hypothetical protein